MSRYLLSTPDEFTVFVGWDNPLQTFFFQKYLNYDQPDEELVLDFGTNYEEISNLNKLVELLEKEQYDLSDELEDLLFEDFAKSTEPTPLQKYVKRMFGKLP